MATRSISLRTDEETLKKIDELAAHEDRSRNWWINGVIQSALAEEEAWRKEIERRIAEADAFPERLIPHETVMSDMRKKYGSDEG